MTVYTDADLRQRSDDVLEEARSQGEVRIKRGDGQEFILRAAQDQRSPLDVVGVKIDPPLTIDEIVTAIHEGRDRHGNR